MKGEYPNTVFYCRAFLLENNLLGKCFARLRHPEASVKLVSWGRAASSTGSQTWKHHPHAALEAIEKARMTRS